MRIVNISLLIFFIVTAGVGNIATAEQKKTMVIKSATDKIFIAADKTEYDAHKQLIHANGNIRASFGRYIISTDDLIYEIKNDLLRIDKDVAIYHENGILVMGSKLLFHNKFQQGVISDFLLKFKTGELLVAKFAERTDENKAQLYKTVFSPCKISGNCSPIWQISAKKTYLDFDKERISYRNVFFEVYSVPILFTPYFAHPTPHAKAQSGVLLPKIQDNTLRIPLYYRAKPNLDFTLTPRINNKYTLFELEARQRLTNGLYILQGNYGEVSYKNKNVTGGYLFGSGAFSSAPYNYGFSIRRASDKAYLKNYHNIHDSYLTSSIYLNHIDQMDYFSLEGSAIQNLRTEEDAYTNSLIFPHVKAKKILYLNDDEQLYLVLENDSLLYRQVQNRNLARFATTASLVQNIQTTSGYLVNLIAKNRADIYVVDKILQVQGQTQFKTQSQRQIAAQQRNSQKDMYRVIPEIQTIIRYPLIKEIGDRSIIIEPLMSLVVGRKYTKSDNRFVVIDSPKHEISEINFIQSNHYNGIDYHEFGNRLNYGFNTIFNSDKNVFSLFMGQSLLNDKIIKAENMPSKDNGEIVGKIAVDFDNNFKLFYRFRKGRHWSPIREEVGGSFIYQNLSMETSLVELSKIKKYYAVDDFSVQRNNIRQAYYNLSYQINSDWTISQESLMDLSDKKIAVRYRNIKVTYLKDCVSIAAKIYNDYTQNSALGVKKNRTFGVSIGLKVLNM